MATSRAARRERVRLGALAAFHEMGVGQTRERSGVLVYVSCLEREALVVPDTGVRRRLQADAWGGAVRAIESAAAGASPALPLAEAVRKLGDLLAAALPVREDDVNELPDEVAR